MESSLFSRENAKHAIRVRGVITGFLRCTRNLDPMAKSDLFSSSDRWCWGGRVLIYGLVTQRYAAKLPVYEVNIPFARNWSFSFLLFLWSTSRKIRVEEEVIEKKSCRRTPLSKNTAKSSSRQSRSILDNSYSLA